MGLEATKPVFGIYNKASFNPVYSATETSKKIEISHEASFHIILSKKRITKAMVRLRRCAGWSALVLFANPRRQVFFSRGPYNLISKHSLISFVGYLPLYKLLFFSLSSGLFHYLYNRFIIWIKKRDDLLHQKTPADLDLKASEYD